MAQEKIRVYQLAKTLNLESTDLIRLCQQHGLDVKNQLSTLDSDLRDRVVELVRKGPSAPAAAPRPAAPQPLPKTPQKVIQNLPPSRPAPKDVRPAEPTPTPATPPAAAVETPEVAEPMPVEPAAHAEPPAPPAEPKPAPAPEQPAAESRPAPEAPARPASPPAPAAETKPTAPPAAPTPPPAPAPIAPAATTPPEAPRAPEQPPATRPPTPPAPPAPPAPRTQTPTIRPMRNLGGPARPTMAPPPRRPGQSPPPAGRPQTGGPRVGPMPTPPPSKIKPGDEKKPPAPTGPKRIAEIPADMMASGKPVTVQEILNRPAAKTGPGGTTVVVPEGEIEDEENKDKDKKKRPGGGVAGRDQRHKARADRAKDRQARVEGGKVVGVDDEAPKVKTLVHLKRRQRQPGTVARKGKVPIEMPITVRSLSEAIGIKTGELIKKLMLQGVMATINSGLDAERAEVIALEYGVELNVKRQLDAEEELEAGDEEAEDEALLLPRAPIVTIMGHVDHGKTSLLDTIRKSNVVDTEAGGITQVLRAWRVEHKGRPITFLDTPGHEAFTKMRARGANVTDIAVIVVAASDGVQPQTEEAISHARAAEVAIVVAINKVDMPNANIKRTESQLYNLGLIPDTMGGDVHFVETSAVTGQGVDELLETISLVADFELELKANPNKPARGTCLEASMSEGKGVMATLLVREGTLRRGDNVLCGAAYGRVREMFSDMGEPIEEAGPSMPCRITGLDEVPNADDPFHAVEDLMVARDIADKRKGKQQEAALTSRGVVGLEALTQAKVTELKVILKADVRGSVEAIKKELEKLHHEEVRVRVLHTGIGAINESDVALAGISPLDTIIVGFNVVPDDAAKSQAEQRGIQIREYNIIYNLTDDIRSALEGKLKPREEIIHLGRAVVRETFKISRVGTIAGCRVTQGVIERSGKVRVIRNGVVIFPPPDRTVGLDSLKRFKDDAREVQQGYECGIKLAGFDDVKVDDVIECYRIEQVQRTLS